MTNALPIEHYDFSGSDALLIDANIWLSLYGPQADPTDRKTRIYSAAFKKILESGCAVFVDVLILSEFVNRYSRLEFGNRRPEASPRDFKKFRESDEFASVVEAVAKDMRRILKQTKRLGSGFEALDEDSFMKNFEKIHPDFNDMVLAELCRKNELKMITHDADFKAFDITVLTANKSLLS